MRGGGVRGSASIIEAVVGLAVKWSDSCTHKHGVRWSMRDVEVEVGQRKMREKREQIIDPSCPPHPPPHTPTRRVRRESIHAAPRVLLWTDGVFQTVMSRPAGRSEADVEPHTGGAVR